MPGEGLNLHDRRHGAGPAARPHQRSGMNVAVRDLAVKRRRDAEIRFQLRDRMERFLRRLGALRERLNVGLVRLGVPLRDLQIVLSHHAGGLGRGAHPLVRRLVRGKFGLCGGKLRFGALEFGFRLRPLCQ